MRLARLSLEGVACTVRLSYPDALPSFVSACALATGGNPFYLRELLASALAEGVQGGVEGAARLPELVPQAVTDSVLLRLSRLPEPAATLAAAVSVLGDGTLLRHAALLAEIPAEKAEQAADVLAEVQVLADGEPLHFAEALTGAAIRESLPTLFRSRLHRRAAELLKADGAEVDAIAAHLLACQPHGDPAAVEVLRSAAERAAAKGDARSAQRFLDRALAEPSPMEVQPQLVMDRALAHATTGTPDAIAHLRESLAVAATPLQRAELMRSLGRLLFARAEFRAAAEALEQALSELGPGDPQEASLVVDSIAVASVAGSSPLPAAAARLEALVGEALSGKLPSDPRLLALASTAMLQAGRPASLVAAMAKEALSGLPIDDNLYGVLNGAAVTSLIAAGDLEAARVRAEDCLHDGAAASPIRAGMANHLLAVVYYCRGDLDATVMACRRSLGALQVGWDICTGWIAPLLAHALMDQGDLEAAAVALGCCPSAGPDRPEQLMARTARALLKELEGGDNKAVARELLAVGPKVESSGLNHLTPQPWWSLAALAAARAGERDQALQLVEEELAHARAFGEPRALGIALRTAGVVRGGPEGTEMLRSAVEVLEGSPAALELAHALVDFGAALRRGSHRVASRSPLRRGLELATSLGATPLAQRAHDELRAAGGRRGAPRDKFGPSALTPAERRVAELAASGLSTPQLARRLHLSAKTVDWHLGHVYQKLGISSRRELQSSLVPKARHV